MDPYTLDAESIFRHFDTDMENGLSHENARKRLSQYGKNELIGKERKSIIAILFDQFKEVMVIILLIAAIISGMLNEYIDAAVILIIVSLNAAIGFWQEFNAENALAALKKMAVPRIRVRRDGSEKEIPAKEVVPGDILIVESGDVISADARLINVANLQVQESALTGESEPVSKTHIVLTGTDIPLGDRTNMIYRGTFVTYGRAEAVVTSTGMQTELGKIASMLQTVKDEQTPLQKRLAKMATILAGLAFILIIIVAALALLRGLGIKETFMTAISMAVAAIPEGLPAVVTIALALGARTMFKKNSLIRHLPAVETLGSVTVICTDKTGTLTQNKMTVTNIILPARRFTVAEMVSNHTEDKTVNLLLFAGALCNDAVKGRGDEGIEIIGDPTEGALILAAEKLGFDKDTIQKWLPRIAEIPFDSNRKRMTTLHQISKMAEFSTAIGELIDNNTHHILFTKGSTDELLEICDHVVADGKVIKMTDKIRQEITAQNKEMAGNGIRVLGFAFKWHHSNDLQNTEEFEKSLIYLGMTGMIDPVREEAVESVRLCKNAGIRVVMITGDHPLTAKAIAEQLGIGENGKYLTGHDLSGMSVGDLKQQIDDVSIFARVSPEHKMIIIDALQEKNQIVSMTGDGVNDAPALKSADIGIAMGITGTDVARESSDMVLLDDNFATIVTAVKEGRTIFDNIRKFIKYILTGNFGEIVVMLTGPFLGMPIPLLPVQILWINLVTDGAPAIALGYEEAENDILNRPPNQPDEGIFTKDLSSQILMMGFFMGIIAVVLGFWFWKVRSDGSAWQTMIFSTITFSQMTYALCVRKSQQSFFKTAFFSNGILLLAILITFVLQLILIYNPFFNSVFKTQPLAINELLICILAAILVIFVAEVEKLLNKKKPRIPRKVTS